MRELFDALVSAFHLDGHTNYDDFCQVWMEDFDYIKEETVAMKHFFRNVFGEANVTHTYREVVQQLKDRD